MNLSTLPPQVQEALWRLPAGRMREVTELRFRKGQQVSLVFPWGQELLTAHGAPIPVTDKLLKELLDRATNFSPYALKLEETGLYLPLEHGCRMGLCGEAVMREGKLWGLKTISSISIRLAREHKGVAAGAAKRLIGPEGPQSALIVSPPGGGKTTFLRDLIRICSEKGFRVSVADERRELGAVQGGVPTLDLGPSTDILSGCPKAQAIPLLLRVMNPQVLALDELGEGEELEAAKNAAFSGVALLATAHGDGLSSLMGRKGVRELLEAGTFDWCVSLGREHSVKMERLGENETTRSRFRGAGVHDDRIGGPAGPEPANSLSPAASSGFGADPVGNGAEYGLCSRAV